MGRDAASALGAAARDPAPRRRGVRRHRPAGRLEDARRARRPRRLVVDRAQRARRARAARAAHAPAHLGRPRARPRPATASTSTRCSTRPEPRPAEFPLGLAAARAEVEEALQATTEMLSQVTRLLALVSAPPLEAATVRHVEVLLLQPNVVMVVVITSTGGVSKQRYTFPEPVDPGLVTWAAEYLRERLVGARLGSRTARARVRRAEPRRARARVPARDPRRVRAGGGRGRQLYVGGAAGLLDDLRAEEIGAYRSLMDALEKRAALLDVLAQSFDPRRPFARVGDELEQSGPARARARRRDLRAARTGRSARSACSARCGWTTRRRCARCAPPRTSCRASSRKRTRRGLMATTDRRLLRAARRPARRRRRRDQEGVPPARARAASRRVVRRPRPRRASAR